MGLTKFIVYVVDATIVGSILIYGVFQINKTDQVNVDKKVYEENVRILPILNQLCNNGNQTACLRAIDIKHDIEDYLEQLEINKTLNQ